LCHKEGEKETQRKRGIEKKERKEGRSRFQAGSLPSRKRTARLRHVSYVILAQTKKKRIGEGKGGKKGLDNTGYPKRKN